MTKRPLPTVQELLDSGQAHIRLRPNEHANEASEILCENRIWFSDVLSQDDKTEGQPHFESRRDPPTLAEIEALARRQSGLPFEESDALANAHFQELQDPTHLSILQEVFKLRLQFFFASSSILSFFKDATERKRWEDYAAGGTGYGLVFQFLEPWYIEVAPNSGDQISVPQPVHYESWVHGRRPLTLAIGPSSREDGGETLQEALLTKSDEWSHQEEERLIRMGIPAGHVSFPPESLRGIVLGYAMTPDCKHQLTSLALARIPPLEVYEARLLGDDEVDLVRIA